MMLDGVPNLVYTVGYVNSSWTLRADLIARWVCRLLRRLRPADSPAPRRRQRRSSRRTACSFSAPATSAGAPVCFPRQGSREPWRIHQNYPLEVLKFWLTPLGRDMVFTRARSTRPARVRSGRRGMTRLPPYEFAGGLGVVTGAASGIGEQLANQLAARASHLHLVDRDEVRLAAVVERIARDHPALTVRSTIFDLDADR